MPIISTRIIFTHCKGILPSSTVVHTRVSEERLWIIGTPENNTCLDLYHVSKFPNWIICTD